MSAKTIHRVISFHIPKTAGTSLSNTLVDVYGVRRVLRMYGKGMYTERVPDRVRVIHGHINRQQLVEIYERNPEWRPAAIITWIRNPVDRMISNYFFLLAELGTRLRRRRRPTLFKRMVRSLDEFD